jgi:hypothetical protein
MSRFTNTLCGVVVTLVLAAFALPGLAHGQGISGLSVSTNGPNSANAFQNVTGGVLGVPGFQRGSATSIESSSTTAFETRYAWVNGTDTDNILNGDQTSVMTSDYKVQFSVTVPGAYDLLVTTERNAGFNLVNDGAGSSAATASMSAITGSQLGGSLSGSLGFAAPATITGTSGGSSSINATSAVATISATSGGSPVAHTLSFAWTSTCNSNTVGIQPGDACGQRGGLPVTITGLGVAGYGGTPVRVQADDGHFVQVTLVSYCGDSIVQAGKGETCDEGSNNGLPGSCCNANCTLVSAGTECRGLGGDCDVTEDCDGVNGACPADGFLPNTTVCRASSVGEVCDIAESCDGVSANCPADAVEPNSTLCRGSTGVCDVADNCDGVGKTCPADVVEPGSTVCRAGSVGQECDAVETCDGVGVNCPADGVLPNGSLCRSTAGVCDVAELCDGVGSDCPADAVEPSSTVCRAGSVGQECDAVETCDGAGVNCPADGVLASGTTCRTAAGVCDFSETCDGAGSDCPADGANSSAQCRASAGVCDVAETCGVGDDCPADGFQPDGTNCDDSTFCNGVQICTAGACGGSSSPCMMGETCDEGGDVCFTGNCPPSPSACMVAAKNKVLIKNNTSDDTKDKVLFKWLKGPLTTQSTFADPITAANYSLCFYAGATPALLQSIEVPFSGTKWTAISTKGYKYKDPAGTEDGITKIIVKSGAAGKSKAIVKGKGMALPDFDTDLPIAMADLPLIVQLRNNGNGMCFEGTFATPKKNLLTQFNAKQP